MDGKRVGESKRPWGGAGAASSSSRRKYFYSEIDFETGRSILSYERHRSRDGRRSIGAIQHASKADRMFFGRLSWMVGWRTAGIRQRANYRRLLNSQRPAYGFSGSDPASRARDSWSAYQPCSILPS